jgi:hypothetical protein
VIVHLLVPIRKIGLSCMPMPILHHLAQFYPTPLLWVGLRMGMGRAAPLSSQDQFQHLRSIVFDQTLPQIAHYWSRGTIEPLMRGAELHDVRLAWVNEVSWSAEGTKPA